MNLINFTSFRPFDPKALRPTLRLSMSTCLVSAFDSLCPGHALTLCSNMFKLEPAGPGQLQKHLGRSNLGEPTKLFPGKMRLSAEPRRISARLGTNCRTPVGRCELSGRSHGTPYMSGKRL